MSRRHSCSHRQPIAPLRCRLWINAVDVARQDGFSQSHVVFREGQRAPNYGASILSSTNGGSSVSSSMSALLFGSSVGESDMSGSFQSGYDYSGSGDSGSGVDRSDHYAGHSGYHHHSDHYGGHSGHYHEEKCCPLVVDTLCVAALLGAIAGATFLLSRTFQIELCNLAGQGINNCVGRRRRRRALVGHKVRLLQMFEGKLSHTFDTISS